jgi:LPPG:FO 2-phospho-L-lactate transferase
VSQVSDQTTPDCRVVLLAGGTGGAKLARGFHALPNCDLTVIANTGDDIDIYESRVCPDPDLVIFHLADMINDRGWGIDGDTFHAMDQLEAIGAESWFRLGDRDLAICLERARVLRQGSSLTEAIGQLSRSLVGSRTSVLPMCDESVRTQITVNGELVPFQEFMIKRQTEGAIENVSFDGIDSARPTSEVLSAINDADVIVVGPSNPAISIGPILAIPGMTAAIAESSAPTVVVSPLVDGTVIKGPTEKFMAAAGVELSPTGIGSHYAAQGICDVLIADSPSDAVRTRVTNVLMDSLEAKRRLAEETLTFGRELLA